MSPSGEPIGPEHLTASDLDAWDASIAKALAEAEGIDLTDDHWDVIHYLRARCQSEKADWSARQVIRDLDKRYEAKGGKRYLYTLFPHGPVFQACKIAGIPMPSSTLDLSFGSVH